MVQCPRCGTEVAPGNVYCGKCGSATGIQSQTPTLSLGRSTGARLSPSLILEERFPPGTILSQRYRISGALGRGGMGEVYRATDLVLGQSVALKLLPESLMRNAAALERLRNEVRLARQITHPNVCRVHDIGGADGQVFLTMEFIDGEDLGSLLRRIGRLPAAKALEVCRQLCAGLAAAHEKGVLHRDLKPANIMLDGRGQVLITDFGLAGTLSDVSHDASSGTPAYMAPEQLAGIEVTRSCDIYALGLVLFEVFSGAQPHPTDNRNRLATLRLGPPPLLCDLAPEVDGAVSDVVARCLAPNPSERPGSALAVAAALPGGDPLAAALAKGEMPSPQLVAAAESGEMMSPRAARACLAALVVCSLAAAWISARSSMLERFATDFEPAAMAHSARQILGHLGYPDRPAWADWSIAVDNARIPQLFRLERAALVKSIDRDPPLNFWYRSSPRAMVSSNPFQPFATFDDPPLSEPGMLRLRLNRGHHLQSLTVVPMPRDPNPPPAPSDWRLLFDNAGLDMQRFETAGPIWTPPTAFDARAAWLEKSRSDPLRVEAALWHGRPVFFQSMANSAAGSAPPNNVGGPFAAYIFALLLLVSALGYYNLRKRRGDLKGALRFALFMSLAAIVRIQMMAPHPVGVDGWLILVATVGNTLWTGATTAIGYLALEPFVRKKWPRALIAWSRLLNGQYRDSAVGRHLLVGLTCGAVVLLVLKVLVVAMFGVGFPGWSYLLAPGLSRAAQGILSEVIQAASETPWLFCLLFVAVAILRNKWLGALATAAVVSARYLAEGNARVPLVVVLPLLAILLMFFAVRYGLLALVAAMFVIDLRDSPMTLDPSVFYFGGSCLTLGFVLAMGIFAYRCAVSPQRLSRNSA